MDRCEILQLQFLVLSELDTRNEINIDIFQKYEFSYKYQPLAGEKSSR